MLPFVKYYDPIDHLILIYQKSNEVMKSQDDEERKKQLSKGQEHFNNGMAQLNKRCSNTSIELETLSAAFEELKQSAMLNPKIFDEKNNRDIFKQTMARILSLCKSMGGNDNKKVRQCVPEDLRPTTIYDLKRLNSHPNHGSNKHGGNGGNGVSGGNGGNRNYGSGGTGGNRISDYHGGWFGGNNRNINGGGHNNNNNRGGGKGLEIKVGVNCKNNPDHCRKHGL